MLPRNRLRRMLEPRSYYDQYILNWNVKMHHWPTYRQVMDKLASSFFINDAAMMLEYPEAEQYVNDFMDSVDAFTTVQTSMCESLDNADTYFMYSPKRAKKFGLEYKGPGADGPIDMKHAFLGRSGGHLCMTEFDGIPLNRASFDWNDDWYPDQWTRKLCAMIEEWDAIFSAESVRDECLYTCAWYVSCALEGDEELAA